MERTPAVWTQPNGPACPSCILYACCGWLFGQISPDMAIASMPGLLSTTAWLFSDGAPDGLAYPISPSAPFWLQVPAADRAAIAFEFDGPWAGTGKVFSHAQDIAVVMP